MDAKAYAEHRQVSGAMVTKYLQAGMIPSAVRKGRKWDINAELADKDLEKTLNPTEKKPQQKTQKLNLRTGNQGGMPSLAANRAIREMYAARITKLEFEERSKKLVPLNELKLELAKLHLSVRDNLRTVPDRIAPLLAAETDQAKIHSIIMEEIRICLEGLKNYDIS